VMLSTWYIRLSKQRLWGAGMSDEKRTGFEVLYAALSTLAHVIAPFLPYLGDEVHQALGGDRSVHLEDWPKPRPEWRDDAGARDMDAVRAVVRLARSIREDHRIRHRHPLPKVAIAGLAPRVIEANLDLLREELNVKAVEPLADPASLT